MPILVAVLSKTLDCCHSIAGIAGSKPTEVIDVLLLYLLSVVYVAASAMS
jgi:hypothetical protein